MGVFTAATLACALLALFGGIAMARRPPASAPRPAEAASLPVAATPFGRLKTVIEAGDWSRALPPLLVLGGILGVMLFGALSLIFVFGQDRSGWPMFALAVLTIAWAVREYVRAEAGR